MIVLHPTACPSNLLVLLISISRSIASPSPVGGGKLGPRRQDCTGVFTWDPQKPTEDPICIPVDGPRYACKLSSCTFRTEPLTQQNFVFQDCFWDDPQKKGSYLHGDVHATEMYYITWNPAVPNQWIAVTGTQTVDPKRPEVRATCGNVGVNQFRPICSNCWESPVTPVPKQPTTRMVG